MKKNNEIKKHCYEEHHFRSVLKAISYRLTGTFSTMIISFIVTRELKFALSIGALEFISKIFIYYIHERIWDKIKFGKKVKEIEYNI